MTYGQQFAEAIAGILNTSANLPKDAAPDVKALGPWTAMPLADDDDYTGMGFRLVGYCCKVVVRYDKSAQRLNARFLLDCQLRAVLPARAAGRKLTARLHVPIMEFARAIASRLLKGGAQERDEGLVTFQRRQEAGRAVQDAAVDLTRALERTGRASTHQEALTVLPLGLDPDMTLNRRVLVYSNHDAFPSGELELTGRSVPWSPTPTGECRVDRVQVSLRLSPLTLGAALAVIDALQLHAAESSSAVAPDGQTSIPGQITDAGR